MLISLEEELFSTLPTLSMVMLSILKVNVKCWCPPCFMNRWGDRGKSEATGEIYNRKGYMNNFLSRITALLVSSYSKKAPLY